MTPDPRGPAEPTAGTADEPAGRANGPLAAIGVLVERVMGWGPMPRVRFALDAYGDAGGGILAAGLAFGALFALVPGTLFVAGATGFIVADPEVRAALIREMAVRVPPLEEFFTLAIDQLASGAAVISILGLVGFGWTATQFYGQLDHAFALIFDSPTRRDMIERTVRGFIAVGLVMALFVALLAIGIAPADTPSGSPDAATEIVRLASRVGGLGVTIAVVAIVYRIVPTQHISWRAVLLPAVVVGLAEGVLSTVYVIVAPFLASPAILGPFVTVFAALAWLSWTFQILLIGAAWVRLRQFGIARPTRTSRV